MCVCVDLDSQSRVLGSASKKAGVTSAVSDESVAGDSGVYEASEKRFVICVFQKKKDKHTNILELLAPPGNEEKKVLHVKTC